MIYPRTFEQKIGFDKVRLRLQTLATSDGARQMAMTFTFLSDFNAISIALTQTHQMKQLVTGDNPPPPLSTADAPATLAAIKIPGTSCAPADMLTIAKAITTMAEAKKYFCNPPAPAQQLTQIATDISEFHTCSIAISKVLDKFGNVKDNASPALAEIRRALTSMTGTVNSVLRRVMARAAADGIIDSDTTPTVRDGRLVLPVLPMNKRKLPGIIHDESASGKTIFIEPAEVVEVNNRIRQLQLDERREINRIMAQLATTIRPHIPDMLTSVSILDNLDFIHAKAMFAIESGGNMPHISRQPQLEWHHACHPVLLQSLISQNRQIVPLDISLNPKQRILIISGPNAGGKSVCLKTVGIIQYMAQTGVLPTVYENSHFGIFSDIFIDIGDNQSIEDDLSTYSSHLRNMKTFVAKGKPTSLVLIDEFGAGTEPQIGGAIAQAILHRLNDTQLWGVITTHYQNLKHFAENTPGLVNGSMLYDRHLMQPLFKLSIGNAGSSFAIEIAKNTGLPAEIIQEAQDIVGSDYINIDKYLLDTARDKKYWENKRIEIKKKEKQLDQLLEKYQNDADALKNKRKEIIEQAKQQALEILDNSNAAIERTIREIRTAQAEKERTRTIRQKLQDTKQNIIDTTVKNHPNLEKTPRKKKTHSSRPSNTDNDTPQRPLAAGDFVTLDKSQTAGTIISIDGKNATVAFGNIKTTVPLDRLALSNHKPQTSTAQSSSYIGANTIDTSRQRQLEFNPDIDIRGMRVDEAIQAVTYFIDDATQFSAGRVRILHGTGTGALRTAIRQYLDTVPAVKSYRDEHVQLGGAGITIIDLE